MKYPIANLTSLCLLAMSLLVSTPLLAQELEPRTYSNAPVGLNFLLVGYARSEGGLSVDPALPVEDAKLNIDAMVLAYVRSLELWGKSAKINFVLPYVDLDGRARVDGEPSYREVGGLGDPGMRLSVNLYGAPPLTVQQFSSYQRDLVIGASVQVTGPGRQYDSERLVNIGTNRWSIKPDVGFSKALGRFVVDFTAGVTLYSDNDNFYGGQHREQDPIYSVQSNISYDFSRGMWAALGSTYYVGGQTTIDGVARDDELRNSRVGFIFAMPLSRQHSLKFNISDGISTRIGTSFRTYGIAWQYRWGEGF